MFYSVLAAVFIGIIFLAVLLNFISLPGNWVMAVCVIVCAFIMPSGTFGTMFWAVFLTLIIIGEIIEFYLQIRQGKKMQASTSSNVLGIIGAVIGGIFFMPFLLGFGAVLGSLGGAFTGAFLGEKVIAGKDTEKSIQVAKACLMGKFLGIVIKFGIGIYLVFYTARTVFTTL